MIRRAILWLLAFIPHVTIYREAGVPYMTRYYLLGGPRTGKGASGWRKHLPGNVFLHCFHASDMPIPHNHPFPGTSLILKGRYREYRAIPTTCDLYSREGAVYASRDLGPGDLNQLDAETYHWVELLTPEVWTLFVAGARVQDWGFLTSEGHVPWRQYKARRPGATFSTEAQVRP